MFEREAGWGIKIELVIPLPESGDIGPLLDANAWQSEVMAVYRRAPLPERRSIVLWLKAHPPPREPELSKLRWCQAAAATLPQSVRIVESVMREESDEEVLFALICALTDVEARLITDEMLRLAVVAVFRLPAESDVPYIAGRLLSRFVRREVVKKKLTALMKHSGAAHGFAVTKSVRRRGSSKVVPNPQARHEDERE